MLILIFLNFYRRKKLESGDTAPKVQRVEKLFTRQVDRFDVNSIRELTAPNREQACWIVR